MSRIFTLVFACTRPTEPEVIVVIMLGLHIAPCTVGASSTAAACGTFGVYENRRGHTGRTISLRVVVLKAKHATRQAIAVIAGGPGQSATAFAPKVADGGFDNALSALRDKYDLLFVDNRGMGQSNPFTCDLTPVDNPDTYFRELWPTKLLVACRAKSAASHDLSKYNTDNAVDDLDDLRAALGYPKIVVDGGSYGTYFALVYVRKHGRHVESAVLDSIDPPHFQEPPGSPAGAQTALDGLIAKCRRDTACQRQFPKFPEHFQAVVHRLDKGTLPVPLDNRALALSKEVFVDQVRHAMYDPYLASYVPYIFERAYQRDYAPLGQLVQTESRSFANDVNTGANLSYVCAETMPFINEAQLRAAAAHSFAGDLRFRAEQRACSIWSVQAMPRDFDNPVRSDIPMLFISATDDPGTPPRNGEMAMRYLPNAREVLVQGAGHSTQTPCTERLVAQFVRARSARGLNVSRCTGDFKAPPFATSMVGWPSY